MVAKGFSVTWPPILAKPSASSAAEVKMKRSSLLPSGVKYHNSTYSIFLNLSMAYRGYSGCNWSGALEFSVSLASFGFFFSTMLSSSGWSCSGSSSSGGLQAELGGEEGEEGGVVGSVGEFPGGRS